MNERPVDVLIVDDEPTSAAALASALELDHQLAALVVQPDEISLENLRDATVVVIDYILKGEWEQEHGVYELARQPRDGLALAAVLRSIVDPRLGTEFPLKAYVLHSAMLERLSNSLETLERRPHVLARLNGLDWVFSKKSETPQERAAGIASLARAIHSIRDALGALESHERLARLWDLLKIGEPGADWKEVSKILLQDANPPIHDYLAGTSGLALLRWMLHRLLPHSSFLMPAVALAARLRVSNLWLRSQLEMKGQLNASLTPVTYQGILSDFDGPHFWSPGIEFVLREHGVTDAFDQTQLRRALWSMSGVEPEMLSVQHPTAYLTRYLLYAEELVDIDECISVQPDDWPPFADVPYMKRVDVEHASELIRSIANMSTEA
jgi:hypothetical protein